MRTSLILIVVLLLLLWLLLLCSSCAVEMYRHGYRIKPGDTFTFKHPGVYISDRAMAGMLGKQLAEQEQEIVLRDSLPLR